MLPLVSNLSTHINHGHNQQVAFSGNKKTQQKSNGKF